MRSHTILAALATPLSLAAQDMSPPHPNFPPDPADFPAAVKARKLHVSSYRHAGCPSDGGYAAAAYAALIDAAETDDTLRYWVAGDHKVRLKAGISCLDDLPRFEAHLVRWIREEWEAGLLGADNPTVGLTIGTLVLTMHDLARGSDPATYDLLRSIARDPAVYVVCAAPPVCFRDGQTLDLRQDAAQTMLGYRINGGTSEAEAVAAVAADLAGAPPVLDWRPPGYIERR